MKKKVSAPAKTRVLVVDDHPLFRDGLVQLINRQRDLICCGQAGNSAAALAALKAHRPEFLILDLRLGQEDGLEMVKSCKAQFPSIAILIISQFDEAIYAERALRAGARGYLMKEEATEEVIKAIRSILDGELYVSRKMSVVVLHKLLTQQPQSASSGVESLTDRELQVFQFLGSGCSTRQIADSLHLSVKTIETYRENLKHKLNLVSGVELVRHARGWVQGS